MRLSRLGLVSMMMAIMMSASPAAFAAIHKSCLPKKSAVAKQVTHYYVPLLKNYDHRTCNDMEGTCIFEKRNVPHLYNYGYGAQPLAEARCKNGYGNKKNCLNPCRTVAASMKHHRFGQVLFFEDLVGLKCGNLERDGFEMVHDGFVVVADTGSPKHFNSTGRFDFFWGRCKDKSNGVCKEGAVAISQALSRSNYCMVWDPRDPLKNETTKLEFSYAVIAEAIARGDQGAADDFDLDKTIGPSSLEFDQN